MNADQIEIKIKGGIIICKQEKKDYLTRYRFLDAQIGRLMEERARWQSLAMRMTAGGERRGSIYEDSRQTAMVKVITLEQQLDEQIQQLVALRQQIGMAVETLSDPLLREVLCFYYLHGLTFEETADRMKMSTRHILRLHSKALQEWRVPPQGLPCHDFSPLWGGRI